MFNAEIETIQPFSLRNMKFSGLFNLPKISYGELAEARIGIITYLSLLLVKYEVRKEYENRLLNC